MSQDNRRYQKQELFRGLGPEGQARLREAGVLVAGCGALGGTIATLLVRAGIGRLRVVDRDFLELSNLGRQLLYDEADLNSGLPKAILAARKLKQMNSQVEVQGVVADLNPDNVCELISGVDLILDGLDNQETRYLINDAAVSLDLPWIYAGVIGATGNVMVIIPEKTPCLRCLFPDPAPPGVLPTCDTAGIIGSTPNLAASIAVTEAIKLLSGAQEYLSPGLFTFDLWNNSYQLIPFETGPRQTCPCCQEKQFEFLRGRGRSTTETMCGIDAVQINPPQEFSFNLDQLVQHLEPEDIISSNKSLVRFEAEGFQFSVFPDGRVIIHGTSDHGQARALYDRYIGF